MQKNESENEEEFYLFSYPLNKKIKITKKNHKKWIDNCGQNNVFILQNYKNRKMSIWEYEVVEFFMKKLELNKNSVVLDIGAQQGLYSMLSKFYPNTKWHSFEPFTFSYELLNSNLEHEKITNVTTYNIALSEKKEEKYLYVPKRKNDRGGLNCIAKQDGRIKLNDCDKILVKTDTIDNLFLNEKIDIIKMDVEGFELNVLKGGLNTIKKYRPGILLEYMPTNMHTCGVTKTEFDKFFTDINYKFIQLEFGERFYYPF